MLDVAGMGQDKSPDPGGGQFIGHHAAQAPDATHQNRRTLEASLACLAKIRVHICSQVAFSSSLRSHHQKSGAPRLSLR